MSELTKLRRRVDLAERKLAPLIIEHRDVQADAQAKQSKAYREKAYAANNLTTLVAPRGGKDYLPPKSELELEAIAAGQKLSDVMRRRMLAQTALDQARAELVAEENRILYQWRHLKALHIIAMQNRGGDASLEIAELRAATPSDLHVRRDQRFTVSPQVALVLHDHTLDELNVPCNQLLGSASWGNTGNYEAIRARILAEAEFYSPLEPEAA